MISSKDFSSRGSIVGHPVAELLDHLRGATELVDLRIERSVVGRPVRPVPQNFGLVLHHEFSRKLLQNGQEPVLELAGVGGGLVENLEVHHHPLVVVGAAKEANHELSCFVVKDDNTAVTRW